MPSASTTGIPSRAATVNGIVEFSPPASIGIVCVISRPRCSCSASKACSASSPLGSFSTITVGAPIIADGTTSASSAHLVDVDDRHRAVLADRRAREQLADVGVPAAAGAEDRGADGEVVEIGPQ